MLSGGALHLQLVLFNLQCARDSPGFESSDGGFCISNKLPGNADAVGPWPHFED